MSGPARMPSIDVKYLRPSYGPQVMEFQSRFSSFCRDGDLEQVMVMFDNDLNNSETLNRGLASAVYGKRLDIMDFLLSKGVAPDGQISMAAGRTKSIEVFELLQRHGWDINLPYLQGHTVLLSCLGDEQVVKWLLSHGAHIGPSSNQSVPYSEPLKPSSAYFDMAGSISSIATLNILVEHGATWEGSIALHLAAQIGSDGERIPMMARLIEIGFDVNASDTPVKGIHGSGTPLCYAVLAKSAVKVEFLLANGADASRAVCQMGKLNEVGDNLLIELARHMNQEEIVQLLQR